MAFLREKGYAILERDWHSKHRDIDIIAQDGETTVFVEVKTRKSRDISDPLDAIGYQKRNNLRHAVQHYLHYRNITDYRFDVISIIGDIDCKNPASFTRTIWFHCEAGAPEKPMGISFEEPCACPA